MTPPESPFRTVAVLGAGLMGAGIAQACAEIGLDVRLYDITEDAIERGIEQVDASLPRRIRSGAIADDHATIRARIVTTRDLAAAVDGADLVVEAAPEDERLKLELFAKLDPHLGPDTVVGSNTSQISISRLAAGLSDATRFVGLHFFNPVPVMGLVEVIPGLLTSGTTMDRAVTFGKALGKTVVRSKDTTGFIASRVNMALALEAYRVYDEGVGTAEGIDQTFRIGFGHPMGPLELADYLGIDTVLAVAEGLLEAFGERFRPPEVLRRMVDAGWLGRKTGRGFYDYAAADAPSGG